jgi:hypothetical protein
MSLIERSPSDRGGPQPRAPLRKPARAQRPDGRHRAVRIGNPSRLVLIPYRVAPEGLRRE